MKRATAYFILVLIIVAGCSAYRTAKFKKQYGPVRTVDRTVGSYKAGEVSFYDEVQPILERRCYVCHGCYDAPCQLKLTSYEGLERGGTKKLVYDTTRLRPEKPTRLFIDANSVEEWRQMGFHPVLNERDQTPQANLEDSVVNLMLQLKKENPQPETELLPDREFYRLVRSKTAPGEPVVEINTVRPYDDPGVEKFYYRFRRIETTIVRKNHTVYRLNRQKMERFIQLFLQDDYEVNELPSYDLETASNPFKTFAVVPAGSRYRFLLDDAQYIVMGFIKGPVCRGQIALNVINDHFFIAFFDPEKDTISNDTAIIASVSDYLNLPAGRESNVKIRAQRTRLW